MTKYIVQNNSGQWLAYDASDEHYYWVDRADERHLFTLDEAQGLDDVLLEEDGISPDNCQDWGDELVEWTVDGVVVARAVPVCTPCA